MTSHAPAPAADPVPFEGAVAHLAAEYWPYARTGGLAEAVRGIAMQQAREVARQAGRFLATGRFDRAGGR